MSSSSLRDLREARQLRMNTGKNNSLLLIEHDPDEAKLILNALDDPEANLFDVEWAGQLSDGLRVLSKGGIDLVLLDLMLPDSQGLATFEKVFATAPDIPIVVYSRPSETGLANEAIDRGAYYYFLKGHFDKYTLTRALRYMIGHKKLEEVLLSENELAQVTLNAIGDAVLSVNAAGKVTFLNPAAESMTGWSRQEAVGRPHGEVLKVIDAVTREPVANPMHLTVWQGGVVKHRTDSILISRGGSEFSIENSGTPLRDRLGRVTGAVMVFRDVSAAREMSLRMSYLAQHDHLTGLPNRLLLADRIKQAICSAKRNGEQLAVLFLDLDRFKSINDSAGHFVGDQLLQSVAQRLVSCGRQSDTVSRQGGDEFVLLLPQIGRAQDAAVRAQKILAALAEPYHIAGHELYIQASIGIATYPNDGREAETLLKSADRAMYSAKESGPNNYSFCHADLNARANERQPFESLLRLAVDRGEFVLHYQPKINLQTGEISGVEALVRWDRPGHELLPAAQFVALAEDCGLIVPLGRWVLREACTQLRMWIDQGLPSVSVTVNLAAAEFRARSFLPGVRAALEEAGVAPGLLEFDLTENVLMDRARSSLATLQALKDLGVQLTFDGFGTGYTSLSYLKKLPIHAFKIDRSFIHQINAGTNHAAITRAVIDLAKSLKQRVIAEGVETREQRNFLKVQGCSDGQGYYFSRPVPAEKCGELLRAGIAEAVV